MKKLFYVLICSLVTLFFTQSVYGAGSEMEILLKKLQEKGVLTASEAESISKETKEAAAAAEKAAEKKEQTAKASELPDWIKNTKFKGDLRLRYQGESTENDSIGNRGRGRIRLRLGAETTVADNIQVGFGLATGTGDPRSTNQTMENTFQKKEIRIDYAYAQYKPVKWFSIIGGKFDNPIWRPGDLLWDSDITTEGAGLKLEGPVSSCLSLFLNAGFFILDEKNSGKVPNPLMYAFQPGVKWNITKDTHLKLAGAYYAFSNVKGNVLDYTSGSNTLQGGKLKYEYNAPAFTAELGFKNPFGSSFLPYIGLFGEYISNSDPSEDKKGYLGGVTFGYPSIKKFCDWNIEYTYRRLETDAWLDVFPDSDSYGGKTNAMGHRVKFAFGLTKNVSFGVNYYSMEKIRGRSDNQNLFQTDLILKF